MMSALYQVVVVDESGAVSVDTDEEMEEEEVDNAAVDGDKVEKRVGVGVDEEDVGIEKNTDQASSMYYGMAMMQEVLCLVDA